MIRMEAKNIIIITPFFVRCLFHFVLHHIFGASFLNTCSNSTKLRWLYVAFLWVQLVVEYHNVACCINVRVTPRSDCDKIVLSDRNNRSHCFSGMRGVCSVNRAGINECTAVCLPESVQMSAEDAISFRNYIASDIYKSAYCSPACHIKTANIASISANWHGYAILIIHAP